MAHGGRAVGTTAHGAELVGEYFSAWSEAAQVALIVTDQGGSIDYRNDQCQRMYPLKHGDSLDGLFLPSELPKINEALELLHAEGTPVDVTAVLWCGERIARFVISRVVDDRGATRAMICVFRDVTEQGMHERRLEYEVAHDELTGVLSRAAAIRRLEDHYRSTSGASIALLFVDLDDFKGVNDGYGHLVGDEILRIVAQRLETAAGEHHSVARMGGDEFVVILAHCQTQDDAVAVAAEIAAELDKQIQVGDRSMKQRFSIGVAFDWCAGSPCDGAGATVHVERLLAEADMAMYVAKSGGRSVAVADDSTRTWNKRRLVIERDLAEALERGDITFHYQPVVLLASGQWMAAEALLRWEHPELGMLPPDLVVERAEIIGAANELTKYTLDRVYSDWATLLERSPVMWHHQIAINVSAQQLRWSGFTAAHMASLEKAGLTPQHVLVEVTESSQIELHQGASTTLNELVACGSRVALDDFGVGYNALSYFNQFPIHAIKIDRSLVCELRGRNSMSERLLGGVIQCADALGARVVGEGIETAEAAEHCRSLGMVYGQGWHFARPMPIEQLIPLSREHGLPRTGDSVVLPGDPQIDAALAVNVG